MIASYIMGIVLVTQKTDALGAIVIIGAIVTLYQLYYAYGGAKRDPQKLQPYEPAPAKPRDYESGIQRAKEEARQRGIVDRLNELIEEGAMVKFNVEPERIKRLVTYVYNLEADAFHPHSDEHHEEEHVSEPSRELEATYQQYYNSGKEIYNTVEMYSHYGIFTFIAKYYANWINEDLGRDAAEVQQSMISLLFPLTDDDIIWEQYRQYAWVKQPEPIWQFSRQRYQWAKDQWPNLSGRLTTIWTLQEMNLIPDEVDIKTIISINSRNDLREVKIHTHGHDDDPTESTD
jgi:hypothetical protein